MVFLLRKSYSILNCFCLFASLIENNTNNIKCHSISGNIIVKILQFIAGIYHANHAIWSRL